MERKDELQMSSSGLFIGSEPLGEDHDRRMKDTADDDSTDRKDKGDDDSSDKGDSDGADKGDGGEDTRDLDGKD